MKKLRIFRIVLALASFLGITALFADPSDSAFECLGWLAKIQFGPACIALSLIALGILAFTLIFGRLYCSVVCPLGILQDFAIRLRGVFVRNGFRVGVNGPRKARSIVRLLALVMFVSGGFLGLHFAWLDPYAIYGRLASVTVVPFGRFANNQLAELAERYGSYAVIAVENVLPPVAFIVGSAALAALIFMLAAWKGRFWCNTVCPVGTVLGFVAKFAWLKPRIDAKSCVSCKACERRCKGRCIDVAAKSIDATRCVACYDCSAVCPKGAITWK